MAPVDVVFGRYHVTQPDLLFISRERLGIIVGGKVHGAPDLIIEILSPGTRDHDLGWKKTLYAREGIRDYWIGDPLHSRLIWLRRECCPQRGRSPELPALPRDHHRHRAALRLIARHPLLARSSATTTINSAPTPTTASVTG